MNYLSLIDSGLNRLEQISEEQHWSIRNGEINLLPEDELVINSYRSNLQDLLKLLLRLYMTHLVTGDLTGAGRILRYLPRLGDPYIPEICRDLYPDCCNEDRFLDSFSPRQE